MTRGQKATGTTPQAQTEDDQKYPALSATTQKFGIL
jgi:hypothetical protein